MGVSSLPPGHTDRRLVRFKRGNPNLQVTRQLAWAFEGTRPYLGTAGGPHSRAGDTEDDANLSDELSHLALPH